MMRPVGVIAIAATLSWTASAQAQTPAAPAGTQLNPNKIIIGTGPGTVAGGDALAATAEQAAAAIPRAAITWDGAALSYAVPNGPRVCVVVSPACPGLLPNADAKVPPNAITVPGGGYLFDPVTGQFLTDN